MPFCFYSRRINAEAAWELGLFDQTVADKTINLLRDRAGVSPMNVSMITSDFDPMRDKGNAPWWTGKGGKFGNYEDIGDFIGNQGLAITMSAILLLLFWHFANEALAQFKKQKDLDRENLKADKELEREDEEESHHD